jgi:hypothetical protein
MAARWLGSVVGAVVDRSIMFGFGVVGRMAGKSCVSGEVERARFRNEALAAAEEEFEVHEPQSHAVFSDGGWWFHNEDDHRFVVLEGSVNCQQCGCPRKAEKVAVDPVDAQHHGGYRMEVRDGNVIPIPLLPEEPVDRVEAILEYHHPLEQPQYRDGGLWCNCGTFCLNPGNHRRHVAQVIANLYAADERVAPVVRKHQQ